MEKHVGEHKKHFFLKVFTQCEAVKASAGDCRAAASCQSDSDESEECPFVSVAHETLGQFSVTGLLRRDL